MKTYIKPYILVTKVATQSPLAGSRSVKSVSGLDGVTNGEGDFAGGSADSRRGDLWDDED